MLIFKLDYAPWHADVLNYQILENTLPNGLETRDMRAQKDESGPVQKIQKKITPFNLSTKPEWSNLV